jgi:hypothetical protein
MVSFSQQGGKFGVNRSLLLKLSRADSSFFGKHLTNDLGFVKLESMRLKFESSTPTYQ